MKNTSPLILLALFIISLFFVVTKEIIFTSQFDGESLGSQQASVIGVKKINKKDQKTKKRKISNYSSAQATLDEIQKIQTSGTLLSENHYYDLKKRLDNLAQRGVSGLEPYYQAIEKLSSFAVASQDAMRQTTGRTSQKLNCVSNPSPIFTHYITDIDRVNYIVPPPTMGAGPGLKTHSYIGTDHARVPIYAPVNMTLKDGTYYVGGPYGFDFQVSCEVTVRFGHMTEPIDALKKLLPNEPATDSRSHKLSSINFKAGELVGYTTGTDRAGNWDYGVYNSTVTNRYANDPTWNKSDTYTTAVCPFDYFTADLKAAYVSKFKPEALAGNPPHGESLCKF